MIFIFSLFYTNIFSNAENGAKQIELNNVIIRQHKVKSVKYKRTLYSAWNNGRKHWKLSSLKLLLSHFFLSWQSLLNIPKNTFRWISGEYCKSLCRVFLFYFPQKADKAVDVTISYIIYLFKFHEKFQVKLTLKLKLHGLPNFSICSVVWYFSSLHFFCTFDIYATFIF